MAIEYRDILWDFTWQLDRKRKDEFLLRVLSEEEDLYRPPSDTASVRSFPVHLPSGWVTSQDKGRSQPLRVTRQDAKKRGEELWEALPEEVTEPLRNQNDSQRPWRIKISSLARQVNGLCWEWLNDGSQPPLALRHDVRLTRSVPTRFRTPPLTVGRPIRVLIVLTNPKDERLLNPYREISAIEAGLQQPDYAMSVCHEPNLAALRRHLQEAPHIVHYIGHSGVEHGEGNLILHDERDRTYWMSAVEIKEILPSSVRLACLSTCFTAPNYQVQGLSRLAHASAEFSLPTMVANQYDLDEQSVRIFWQEFYSALVRHDGNVNEAVHAGRLAAVSTGGQFADWASSVLVVRDQTGQSLRLSDKKGSDLEKIQAAEFVAQYSARLVNEDADQLRLLGPDASGELREKIELEAQRTRELIQKLSGQSFQL